jgi:cobalt-precorrin 5A hydrolase
VISTTTEAVKTVIAGVGCRRGTAGGKIVAAVREALERAGLDAAELRMIASADLKKDEPGLMEAAAHFGVPIRLVPSAEIRSSGRSFAVSDFVVKKTGLPAVAEPAALLAGRRTRLILPKLKVNGVTVALARESFTWSE